MNTKKTKASSTKKVSKSSSKPAAKKAKLVTKKKTVSKAKPVVAKKVAAKKVSQKSKVIPALKKIVEAKKISHKRESRLKRMAYMTMSVLLGLLLGTFMSLFLELVYVRRAPMMGSSLQTHYFLGLASYLPYFVQPMFLLIGLIFGVWLGFWGWKMVYIERRHRMYQK